MGRSDSEADAVQAPHAAGAAELSGNSLLRMSFVTRLGVAAVALCVLWGGVFWALS